MGSKKGSGYLLKRGKFFYVRVKSGGKDIWKSLKTGDKKIAKEKARVFTHPFEADDRIATLNNLIAACETEKAKSVVKDEKIELKKMLFVYLNKKVEKISEGTISNTNSYVNQFLRWFKKSSYMCEVTRRDANNFYIEKKGELTKERLNAIVFCLRRVWKLCMKFDNNILENPWDGMDIKTRKSNKRKRRELTADEITELLKVSCSERFEKYWHGEVFVLFTIGAFTALRLMDCVDLRWHEIGRDVITKLPHKTAESGKEAIIPISGELRRVLNAWKASGRSDNEYVLPNLSSSSRRKINKIVHDVFEAAGIKICEVDASGHRHIKTGFHALRVHGLSEFMRITGNINIVQTIAGHATPDMTLWYTHCQKQDVINAFAKQTNISEHPAISSDTMRLIYQSKKDGESVDEYIRKLIEGRQNVASVEIVNAETPLVEMKKAS